MFSSDSSKSRILIGLEVHSAHEYDRCIAQFGGRSFPNPLLKFSVFDETPHKVPKPLVSNTSSFDRELLVQDPFHHDGVIHSSAGAQPFVPISFSHIPPPPIIYSSCSSSASSLPPMDVDGGSTPVQPRKGLFFPQYNDAQPKVETKTPAAVNSAAQGKSEVETLIAKFKQDLDGILRSNFGTSPSPPSSFSEVKPMTPSFSSILSTAPSSLCLYKYCTQCSKIFQGPWYTCDRCDVVMVCFLSLQYTLIELIIQ